jgi:hypothetical protein
VRPAADAEGLRPVLLSGLQARLPELAHLWLPPGRWPAVACGALIPGGDRRRPRILLPFCGLALAGAKGPLGLRPCRGLGGQ